MEVTFVWQLSVGWGVLVKDSVLCILSSLSTFVGSKSSQVFLPGESYTCICQCLIIKLMVY